MPNNILQANLTFVNATAKATVQFAFDVVGVNNPISTRPTDPFA